MCTRTQDPNNRPERHSVGGRRCLNPEPLEPRNWKQSRCHAHLVLTPQWMLSLSSFSTQLCYSTTPSYEADRLLFPLTVALVCVVCLSVCAHECRWLQRLKEGPNALELVTGSASPWTGVLGRKSSSSARAANVEPPNCLSSTN